MRAPIEALVQELRRLRALGEDGVYLADGSLERLCSTLQAHRVPQEAAVAVPGGVVASARVAAVRNVAEQQETAASVIARSLASSSVNQPAGLDTLFPMPKPTFAPATTVTTSAPIPPPPVIVLPEGDKLTQWNWLRDRVLNCPVCNAHVRKENLKKVVFGVGSIDADIFFCGEAPGADEEDEGEPFVGRAGQLLNKIIAATGLGRKDVYISNIMNWRPEMPSMEVGNRPPTADEIAFCRVYLLAQLKVVKPKVIVALGNSAITGLLGADPKRRMGVIRGTWQEFEGIALMPTFHPSYLLRNQTNATKRIVWEDMMKVMERIGMPISEKQRGFFL
ncbi:MAG: uracil-DNA glycosylase [Verrucomicrobiota bacterium]|nr:uracil-DNA glycosylase [Verrucomicrobiota bacterium]